jgi:hypothetical protein
MYKKMTACAVLALLPSVALAQSPARGAGFVDVYFVPSANLDVTIPNVGSGDDDGDGFGVRGMGSVSDEVALTGEYQSTGYDDSGLDVDQLRFGVGLVGKTTSGVFIEYVDFDFEGEKADGFGLQARLAGQSSAAVGLYGQLGYVSIEDSSEKLSGLEFSVGASFRLNEQTALLADFRKTHLEGEDSKIEFEFTDVRVGVRLRF